MKFAHALLLVLVVAGSARAGIYNTTDNDEDMKLSRNNVLEFWNNFWKVRSIGHDKVDNDCTIRKRYFFEDALGGAKPAGDLTLEQKLDYSAVLIRRRKFQQAIEFLQPLVRQHPEIFLFDSHLAMAYWGSGQAGNDRRAVEIMTQMLSKRGWPENFEDLSDEQKPFFVDAMRWSEGPFYFYRKQEAYLLKLMKLRLAEPAGKPYDSVDAIFDVKFVNENGTFAPGQTAAAELKKLPKDAIETVEQLLYWLPDDFRLYWLLGEVANTRWRAEQLKLPERKDVSAEQYSQAVAKYNQAVENLTAMKMLFDTVVVQGQVRAATLRDRRNVVQDFAQTVARIDSRNDEFKAPIETLTKDPPAETPMRTLAITFAAGVAVGIFAVWQFQEIRRRRRA